MSINTFINILDIIITRIICGTILGDIQRKLFVIGSSRKVQVKESITLKSDGCHLHAKYVHDIFYVNKYLLVIILLQVLCKLCSQLCIYFWSCNTCKKKECLIDFKFVTCLATTILHFQHRLHTCTNHITVKYSQHYVLNSQF